MTELRREIILTLQDGGMERLASEIRAAVPPAVLPALIDLLDRAAMPSPRPGDPKAPTTTR
jgi:hypothetical protein